MIQLTLIRLVVCLCTSWCVFGLVGCAKNSAPVTQNSPVSPAPPPTASSATPDLKSTPPVASAPPEAAPQSTPVPAPSPTSSTPDATADPVLSSISVSPSVVHAGDTFTVRVDISAPAPPGGASVTIKMDGVTEDPIVIPEGDGYATLSGWTAGSNECSCSFEADYMGSTASAALTISPVLQSVTVTPADAYPGDTLTCVYTISSPAPPGGVTIDTAANDDGQQTSGQITIPEGDTNYTMTEALGDFTNSYNGTIDATYDGVTLEAAAAFHGRTPDCSSDPNDISDDPCIEPDGETNTFSQYHAEQNLARERGF